MPGYRAPQTSQPQTPATSAPQTAPPAASEAEGSPEWMSRYNLSAGNAATLTLVSGATADEATASSLLTGESEVAESEGQETAGAGPETAAPATDIAGAPPEVDVANAPKAVPVATPSHTPTGTLKGVYQKNERVTATMKLTLTNSQKNELAVFRANWEKHHDRYESVAAKTGVPAKLIAAIHYREGSMRWDTYLHQGDPLGKKAIHHPSNIPIFYKWEDAAVHALNQKKGIRDSMGMDETTEDAEAIATYAEAYNGLGYYNKGRTSAYVYSGTDAYKGGRYVADGVYDSRSWDRRVGIVALTGALDGLEVGSAPKDQGPSSEEGWAMVVEGHEVLESGSDGEGVRALQEKLTAAGFPAKADGSFGAGTKNAVKAFQAKHGLPADGRVGRATAAALDGKEPATTTPGTSTPATEPMNPEWARVLAGGLLVRRGDQGEHVSMIQKALTAAGYAVEAIGTFGPQTEKQVKAFQRANRLDDDGVVGQRTARALKVS